MASWKIVFQTGSLPRAQAGFSPVLGLTSKRGKLLEDKSRRIRCPLTNRLLVGGSRRVNG